MKKATANIFKCTLLLLASSLVLFSFIEPAEWQIFESKTLRFTIKFPGKPLESEKTEHSGTDSALINVIQFNASADTSNNNLLYMVSHTSVNELVVSKEKKESMFEHTITGITTSTKGKVLSRNSVNFDAMQAEDVKIDMQGKAIFTVRVILTGHHYYTLGVITRPRKQDNADIKKFLDSFKSE